MVITTRNNDEGEGAEATPSVMTEVASVPAKAPAPLQPQPAPAATSAKAKAKDEEAGTRQRYKRQPKSRYSHHRQMKANKSEQQGQVIKAKATTSS